MKPLSSVADILASGVPLVLRRTWLPLLHMEGSSIGSFSTRWASSAEKALGIRGCCVATFGAVVDLVAVATRGSRPGTLSSIAAKSGEYSAEESNSECRGAAAPITTLTCGA